MNIPPVIIKRLVLTFLAGTGCLFISLAGYFYAADSLLLFLGIFFFLMCCGRSCILFFKGLTGSYAILEGECREVRHLHLTRFQRVLFMDQQGEPHLLQLDKSCRIHPGNSYRLYFSDDIPARNTSASISALLFRASVSGNFLGWEELPPDLPE